MEKIPQNLVDYLEKVLERPYTDWEYVNGWRHQYVLRDFDNGFNIEVVYYAYNRSWKVSIGIRKPKRVDNTAEIKEGDSPDLIVAKVMLQRCLFESDASISYHDSWNSDNYKFPRKLKNKAILKAKQNNWVKAEKTRHWKAKKAKEKADKLAALLPETTPRPNWLQKVLRSCVSCRQTG